MPSTGRVAPRAETPTASSTGSAARPLPPLLSLLGELPLLLPVPALLLVLLLPSGFFHLLACRRQHCITTRPPCLEDLFPDSVRHFQIATK